jgi:hypothetical protein
MKGELYVQSLHASSSNNVKECTKQT